jgi:hypothetical protein
MKFFSVDRRSSGARFHLTILSLVLSGAVALSKEPQKSKPTATPKPALTPQPTSSPESIATPKPAPTPDTKIDAKMEAELLEAEDRFINAIRNHDEKELEAILHPYYADAIDGQSSARTKHGVILRATDGSLPAYRIEKERKLTRSGDSFTVEGLGRDVAHELTEDKPSEEWALVRRIWSRETGHFIATAQIITPLQEKELREKLAGEGKEK